MAKNALRFDRKATILVPTKGKDAAGYPNTTYAAAAGAARWCRRDDIGGREARVADALRSEAVTVFTFSWFTGLTSEHRIFCEGRTYDIVAPPVEIGRRMRLEVAARERPAQTD